MRCCTLEVKEWRLRFRRVDKATAWVLAWEVDRQVGLPTPLRDITGAHHSDEANQGPEEELHCSRPMLPWGHHRHHRNGRKMKSVIFPELIRLGYASTHGQLLS